MNRISSLDIASSVWNAGSNDVLFQLQQTMHNAAPGQAFVTLHGEESDRSIDCLAYLKSIDALDAAQMDRWSTDQHALYAFEPEGLSTIDPDPGTAPTSWLMGPASNEMGTMTPRRFKTPLTKSAVPTIRVDGS